MNSSYQQSLGEPNTPSDAVTGPFEDPVPKSQSDLELDSPQKTKEAMADEDTGIPQWLWYIENQYTPPEGKHILLLYPCAGQKPMKTSNTYKALSRTLQQLPPAQRNHVHVLTVSEPMALVPDEYHEREFTYDCPGLFKWYCSEHDTDWNETIQQQCLHKLGKTIAGFLERATNNNWYEEVIACVRHRSLNGNQSISQTHRQMLETAESITGISLDWYPTDKLLDSIPEEDSYPYRMQGVAYDPVQQELLTTLQERLADDETPLQTDPPRPDPKDRHTAPTRGALQYNHPKNALAAPLAHRNQEDTDALITEYAVNDAAAVKRAAETLGLLNSQPNKENEPAYTLAPLGETAVLTAEQEFNSLTAALESIGDLKRSQTRFIEAAPEWETVCQRMPFHNNAMRDLIEYLRIYDGVSLLELAENLLEDYPGLADELLFSTDVPIEELKNTRVNNSENATDLNRHLEGTSVYCTTTAFQLKTLLWHCNVLTEPGTDSTGLEPIEDHWELEPDLTA